MNTVPPLNVESFKTTESELLIGHCPEIKAIRKRLQNFAPLNYPVLIQGETGTGKEYAARYLHQYSPNPTAAFVAVNCGALQSGLAAAELFGCRRGAFTGAQAREGLIRQACGGTLFLDEVADLPLDVQVMLLRTLESNRVRSVGSDRWQEVSFRLICASHKSLEELVRKGQFRKDLYFRLSILRVRMPSLRNRKTDLPMLIDTFWAFEKTELPKRVMHALQNYDYPGNLRELRNILISLRVQVSNGGITDHDLEQLFPSFNGVGTDTSATTLNQKVSHYIRECYVRQNGNIRRTARALDISPTTVYKYLSLIGVDSLRLADTKR